MLISSEFEKITRQVEYQADKLNLYQAIWNSVEFRQSSVENVVQHQEWDTPKLGLRTSCKNFFSASFEWIYQVSLSCLGLKYGSAAQRTSYEVKISNKKQRVKNLPVASKR